ncbi:MULTISPECIES: gluconokinase [Mycobacterium]|uniref:Gluconokinase n=1 Tax=Mycobacterium gordonae TaxID=1778 RepID=A0A1A6BCX9_MYCGO|nr:MULTISPECIES: gluconokinase [Mycobacterium]MBI2702970.1 gluconokinase [Mycobacterium sp.]MBX9982361.1 gluconokinase [Mycobacterium gordonae]MCQ4364958.1 gluconokinase [Mycobacterium gordonae]MCV7007204.1 gluconokinase [Mycobacterium gordonae]OBS00141.1 gluconate kinase [Mycobacterium gordonae]
MVIGVSGSGKSTVGAALARRLGVAFEDADHLHPPANIDKMTAGEPLTDDDRYPWLDKVGEWLAAHPDGVMSCSALRRAYRDRLRRYSPSARFLHLRGRPDLIAARLAARSGHFMPATLLQSQLDTLEPLGTDEPGVVIDIDDRDVNAIVDAFLTSAG